MHRTISRIAANGDLLVVTDFSGFVHCLDAETRQRRWIHDFAGCNVVLTDDLRGTIYIADEDGDVAVFKLSADPLVAKSPGGTPLNETNMNQAIYATPTAANNTLYIVARNQLVAIKDSKAQATATPSGSATRGITP